MKATWLNAETEYHARIRLQKRKSVDASRIAMVGARAVSSDVTFAYFPSRLLHYSIRRR
jgi:hypothetical protein